jgi:hypothetical protein
VISLTILQSNGEPLPDWLHVDTRLGMLRGVPPQDTSTELEIRVIARDQNGNQVDTAFRIKIAKSTVDAAQKPTTDARDRFERLLPGKAGLSKQLRLAGRWGQMERDRLVRLAASR